MQGHKRVGAARRDECVLNCRSMLCVAVRRSGDACLHDGCLPCYDGCLVLGCALQSGRHPSYLSFLLHISICTANHRSTATAAQQAWVPRWFEARCSCVEPLGASIIESTQLVTGNM